MPKKGRSNLGRLTKKAKDMRKKREDDDYAAVEREKNKERFAAYREDAEFREQKRLEQAEYRKTKAFSDAKSGKQKDAFARKNAEEEEKAAHLKKNTSKLYYIRAEYIRKKIFYADLEELGYNSLRASIEPDYRVEWFDQLKEDKPIEWMRAVLEDMWGRRCRQGCSSSNDSCNKCKNGQEAIRVALHLRAQCLGLSHDRLENFHYPEQEVIVDGLRCHLCLNVAMPHGRIIPDALQCHRCDISREVRAKLIDFWNHMDDIRGFTTVFQDHTKFECVCEEDVNLYIACQYHEGLERKDEESRKEEEEIWTGSEEAAEDDEEWEVVDSMDLE